MVDKLVTFPLAPPPPGMAAQRAAPDRVSGVHTSAYEFAEALERLRRTTPILFAQIATSLHQMLDQEKSVIVRIRPDLLQVSQGRLQVATEVLDVVDNCTLIAEKSAQAKAKKNGAS